MEIINAPGHVTASPALVKRDARRWKKTPHVSVVFFTEMAEEKRAAELSEDGDGWTITRKAGKGKEFGMGECAIATKDDARGEIIATHWIKLTNGGGKGRLARPVYAPVVITKAPSGRITLFTNAHLPAHIEGIWARIPMPDRLKVKVLFRKRKVNSGIRTWIEAVHHWRAGVTELAAKHHVDDIVVVPDGNVDAHKKWVREMIHRAWPGLTLAVTKADDLGKRAVGWVLTTMEHTGGHVYKAESSDHHAGRYDLKHLNQPHVVPKPKDPPPPFRLCTYNGARMDEKTKAAIQTLEQGPLKDLAPLTIEQGCYNPGGVAASAGTHDKGGVIDFAPFAFGRKVKAWRDLCGPGWHRTPIPGLWGEHIHVVMAHHGNLSSGAAQQVVEYFEGQDGLADHAHDPNQHHPKVSFNFAAAWHQINDAA